jgi:hypothetical protein
MSEVGKDAPPKFTARQLALLQLRGQTESTRWFVAQALMEAKADGDAALVTKLEWLEKMLARAGDMALDSAYSGWSEVKHGEQF